MHALATALILFAHRGAPLEFPENTIESFRAAAALGADVLEMDVHTSADGQWVVIHDDDLVRTTWMTGRVDELPYSRMAEAKLRWPHGTSAAETGLDYEPRIPLLQDVLRALPSTAMNIDLKAVASSDIAAIIELIRTTMDVSGQEPRVRLVSSSNETQAAIRRHGQGIVSFGMSRSEVIEVVRTAWLFGAPIERLRGLAFQAPAYVRAVGIDWPILTPPVRRLLKRMNCPIHLWRDDGMVDDADEAQRLGQVGVDGVFTDNIRLMFARLRGGGRSEN